jgi:hypothetical protein
MSKLKLEKLNFFKEKFYSKYRFIVGALYKFLSQNTQESFAVSLAIDA